MYMLSSLYYYMVCITLCFIQQLRYAPQSTPYESCTSHGRHQVYEQIKVAKSENILKRK